MSTEDLLLKLLARFNDEGVEFVLVGGQAARLNGFVRATEDVDVLFKASRVNGMASGLSAMRSAPWLLSSPSLPNP